MDVDYHKIFIEMSGASDLNIEGRSDEVQVDISGAATLSALGLEARIGDISVTGASNAKVFVTEDLQVDVSGVSRVRYKGDPKLRVDESGVFSVKRY